MQDQRTLSLVPIALIAIFTLFALAGCETKSGAPATSPAPKEKTANQNPEEAPATPEQEALPTEAAPESANEHDHDHDHDQEPVNPLAPSTEPLDAALGQALQDGVQEITVDELLASGEKYVDQNVQITGLVTDMCYHRRGWFGITNEAQTKVVRVVAAPTFLAPETAVGAVAVAQGTVSVKTIPAEELEHYRTAHKFISDEELAAGGPIHQFALIATGATFKR